MTRTFVDTSALYALLDGDDVKHPEAAGWVRTAGADLSRLLVTHSFVTVETAALVHRRLGTEAVRVFLDAWLPALSIFHVDDELFEHGVTAYRAGLKRRSSLVDHVSFEFMRDRHIDECFGFDDDFADAGFTIVPA